MLGGLTTGGGGGMILGMVNGRKPQDEKGRWEKCLIVLILSNVSAV